MGHISTACDSVVCPTPLYGSVFTLVTCAPLQWVDDTEDWETVVAERERWVQLVQHLEPLTTLYVVVGSEVVKTLPLIPYVEKSQEDEEPVRVPGVVVHLLNDG